MGKNFLMILSAAICLLYLTACWDHVEISEMLIVAGIGLDVEDGGETYMATVEIVNVDANGGENIAAEIVEGEGATLHGAIQNAMLLAGGRMFSNHCKVIVVGDNLARSGINEVIDLILRSPNFRKTVDVMVAEGDTARSVMKQKTVKSDIVSYELAKILKSNEKYEKNTASAGVYELHEILASECPYFVIPAVSARENGGESALRVEGCAVFSRDKLQGFLSGNQSKLFNIITRNAGDMTIAIESPDLSPTPVDVKITKSSPRLTPASDGGILSLNIAVAADASLEKANLPYVDLTAAGTIPYIQSRLNEQLSADIKKLITDIQYLYEADIFEFYRAYEDKYRLEWTVLRQDWDSFFRDVEVNVVSDIHVKGSGLIGNYSPKQGGRDFANALP